MSPPSVSGKARDAKLSSFGPALRDEELQIDGRIVMTRVGRGVGSNKALYIQDQGQIIRCAAMDVTTLLPLTCRDAGIHPRCPRYCQHLRFLNGRSD